MSYKLVRERDGLTKLSKEVKWIEFDKDGKFSSEHNNIATHRSLIMSPFNQYFTWQTTLVTEVLNRSVVDGKEVIKFRTNNSVYVLTEMDEELIDSEDIIKELGL
jgi:hypothetical protein